MGSRGSAVSTVRRRRPADPPFPKTPMIAPHDLGRGRLEEGIPNGRPQKVLRIDASGAPPTLIGRLLVGSYITGQDQVLVTARGGLTNSQRKEVRRVVERLLGMSVVGESAAVVEVQNFIDPSKYELPRLLHRVVEMLREELQICRAALGGDTAAPLGRIEGIEEEVDQLYLLMARQLLLSSDNPQIARDIDVVSHHYQIGSRLVVKVLEVTGDLIHGIGTDLEQNLPGLLRMPHTLTRELVARVRRLEDVLTRTMDAFAALSVVEANATLNRIAEALPKDTFLGQLIARRAPDHRTAVAAQRIVCNLVMALEMLVIANEVTINRCVEPETVALTGTRVALGPRSGARSPPLARPAVLAPHA